VLSWQQGHGFARCKFDMLTMSYSILLEGMRLAISTSTAGMQCVISHFSVSVRDSNWMAH